MVLRQKRWKCEGKVCEVGMSRSMGMRCKSRIGESPSNVAKDKVWDRREGEEEKAMSFLKMGGVRRAKRKDVRERKTIKLRNRGKEDG